MLCSTWVYLVLVYCLFYFMAYLGFADGLFGSPYLRFNLGLSIRVQVVLMLLSVYFCVM